MWISWMRWFFFAKNPPNPRNPHSDKSIISFFLQNFKTKYIVIKNTKKAF
jgi:hypothetical protein